MIDPSVVNYIKKQLHDGYGEDEVRQALTSERWSKDEIEEAFYVVHGDSNPIRPGKEQKPKIFLHQEGPWVAFKDEDEQPVRRTKYVFKSPGNEKDKKHDPLGYDSVGITDEEKEAIGEGKHPSDVATPPEPTVKETSIRPTPKLAMSLAIIGGFVLLANMAMNVLGYGDLLAIIYRQIDLLSFVTPYIINLFAASAGFCSIMFGSLLKARPGLDLYFGVALSLLGLSAFLCGNGYMIGGPVIVASGCLAIIRK